MTDEMGRRVAEAKPDGTERTRARRLARDMAIAGLVALAYFLGGRLGLAIVDRQTGVAAIWPPSGLLLGSLLLVGFRRWLLVVPAVFASIMLVNLSAGNPVPLSLGFALANCAESMAAAWLLLRILGAPPRLDRLRDVLVFLVGAAAVSNALTALISASLITIAIDGPFWHTWRLWWIEDGVGMLIVAPLLLAVAQFDPRRLPTRWKVEAPLLVGGLMAVSFWVFRTAGSAEFEVLQSPYIFVPLVLVLSLRLGSLGSVLGSLVVAAATVWGALAGTGPFEAAASHSMVDAVLAAQSFLATVSATALVVSALYAGHRQVEQSLREGRALLDGLVEGTTDAVYAKDLQGRYRLFNTAASTITGKAPDEVLGRDDTALFNPGDAHEVMRTDRVLMEAGSVRTYEENLTVADGSRRTYLSTKGPLRDSDGRVAGLFGIARDITARKRAEEEIRALSAGLERHIVEIERLNRLYEVLCQVSRAVVRARSREELLAEVCRVLTDVGKLRMAWIGACDSRSRDITPVAVSGDRTGYLAGLRITSEDRPEGRGPTGTAVREARTFVCNDFFADPNTIPWRDAAAKSGFSGSVALPIAVEGEIRAALTVYAGERGYFGEKEVALLEETVEEIAFGLGHLEQEERRLRTEEQLRQSESRATTILESLVEGVLCLDASGAFVSANRAAAEILGLTGSDQSGSEIASRLRVVRPDGTPLPEEELPAMIALRTGRELRGVVVGLRAPEGLKWISVNARPLRDGEGRISGAVASFFDITEQQRAEAKLKHSHVLMSFIIEHARSAIAVHDRELRYIYVSQRYLKDYHIADPDVIGKHHYDVFPDLPQKWRDVHQRALAGEVSSAEEDSYPRADGTTDWTRWECRPWYEDDGQIGGIIVYTEVITDRILAREALRESEARFRTAFDSAPVGIVVTRGGRQLFANLSYARLFGYRAPDEVAGTTITDQFAPEVCQSLLERNRSREAGDPVPTSYETVGLKQDGSRFPVHVSTVGIKLPDGPATLAFLSDLSDRQRAEEERDVLEAKLRHAQKMEAIGTLAGGIAHDFNNILTPVIAQTELALLELGNQESVRDRLNQVLKATRRATSLVSQILALSRKEEEGAPVPVKLDSLVKETTRFLRASLPATIEIRTNVDPTCGSVVGDVSQLHQVLLNLCTNAGYSMSERGGTLTVSLERSDEDPAGRAGRWLRLAVTDTGTGIQPELLGRIFEPYFTTKPTGKGSGLGLAVVHGIVTKLRGEIKVTSTPGVGSTFVVWLPEGKGEEEATRAPLPEVPRGGGQHVLVVDDDDAVRTVLATMVGALGYRVTEAAGGKEALDVFRADPQAFDAVMTDHTMPGLTGLELVGELLALRPGLPVVLGTGFAENVSAESAAEAGVRALLMKPYNLRLLGQILREVLGEAPPKGPGDR
jgi:PAS domain S-box-containing protein